LTDHRRDPAETGIVGANARDIDAAVSTDIMSAVGEVVYEWTVADDVIRWGPNAAAVLGVQSSAAIATGRAYAAMFDHDSLTSRHDAVLNGTAVDRGDGVAYEVEYALNPPDNVRGRLVIDDVGRWYAGPDGRPARARGVIRIINERHEREQRLELLSHYDELTGFFNRQHLLTTLADAMNAARRTRVPVAFIIVAVDNFRAINEAYGFAAADKVFAAVAHRIKAQLRDADAIGRYSGSKLGIVLTNCDEASMHTAAERFHAAVRNGVVTAGGSAVAATVSIGGVALPRHGHTVREVLAHAQDSLHRAREAGWGRFVAYAPSPERDLARRNNAMFSSEIAAALEERRMRLFFQPVVDIATRAVSFHEALLRLERQNGTFAAATDFIELSERLDLIRLIDEYTLQRALETLAAFPAARISLNVSGETVGDTTWLSHLAQALLGKRDVASRLIVEITETSVIRHLEDATHFVATAHDLGCRVAIDDFGAGFSSFRHLRALHVDLVKIAGAFIENLPQSRDDQAFVRALTDLASNSGVEVVAEWVRDEETATILKGYGVTLMQGALTGDATPEWVLAGTPTDQPARRAG
jgi:diguanylate cyclase (GGDEF)-like protein